MQLFIRIFFASGITTSTTSSEDISDIMKKVKSLHFFKSIWIKNLVDKRVSQTIKNESKEQKSRIFNML